MADTEDKKKEDPRDIITDRDTKKTQSFTRNPSAMDYFKEAFLPDNTKAQLEAIRNARAKSGGGY